MSLLLQRYAFSLAAITWGVVSVYFYASGRITEYISDNFQLYCLIGGLALIVLGLFTLLTAKDEASDCGHDHGDEGCGHNHEESDLHPIVALAVMVVPLLVCSFITPDKYSLNALARKGLNDAPPPMRSFFSGPLPPYTMEYLEKTKTQTKDGFFRMPLMEVYFGGSDEKMREVLDGLPVALEGRVVPATVRNPNGTRLKLYRLFMTCCAADSRPIPAVLEFGKEAPTFGSDEWYNVTGTLRYLPEGGAMMPVVEVKSFEKGVAPAGTKLQRGSF